MALIALLIYIALIFPISGFIHDEFLPCPFFQNSIPTPTPAVANLELLISFSFLFEFTPFPQSNSVSHMYKVFLHKSLKIIVILMPRKEL